MTILSVSFVCGQDNLAKDTSFELIFEEMERGIIEGIAGPQPLWHGDRTRKEIALTFDDGPKPEMAPPILEILSRYGVKATFFVVGNEIHNDEDMIYRIFEEGHDIGNHSFSHLDMTALAEVEMENEIIRTNRAIYNITGKFPFYFRPPGGVYNQKVLKIVAERGLKTVNWSLNAADYTKELPFISESYFDLEEKANEIINKVINNAANGDIILFHNGGTQTVLALPKIIEALEGKGFSFVTLSQMLVSKEGQTIDFRKIKKNFKP